MRTLAKCGLLLVLVALGGCYLPSAFEADLRITPAGDYNFQYRGLLVHLPLLEKLSDPVLPPAEVAAPVYVWQVDGFDQPSPRLVFTTPPTR